MKRKKLMQLCSTVDARTLNIMSVPFKEGEKTNNIVVEVENCCMFKLLYGSNFNSVLSRGLQTTT